MSAAVSIARCGSGLRLGQAPGPRAGRRVPYHRPMAALDTIRTLPRRDRGVTRVVKAWRDLTGGTRRHADRSRRTLVACSGGADSSALVLALASGISDAAGLFVVAHVVHDLRPSAEASADRDAAAELASALGLPFVEGRADVRGLRQNLEAAARRLRYAQLARLAEEHDCPYVATAHHADDQLETVLMGLIRGSGLRGLRGVAASRPMGASTACLIRPMLDLTRPECERLCREAGWAWREDATNRDTTRLRAAVRHGVAADLERLRPGASHRAARTAALLGDAAGLVRDRVRELWVQREGGADGDAAGWRWPRGLLRAERAVVLGDLLLKVAGDLRGGAGRDRIGARQIEPAVRAIRGQSTERKVFGWSGVDVVVTAHGVTVRRSE